MFTSLGISGFCRNKDCKHANNEYRYAEYPGKGCRQE